MKMDSFNVIIQNTRGEGLDIYNEKKKMNTKSFLFKLN